MTREVLEAVEVNCDGLVGPTHSYAGLSPGNIASELNRGEASNPRAAVLQGLAKMKRLADLGIPQFVLPPQERPFIPFLRGLGCLQAVIGAIDGTQSPVRIPLGLIDATLGGVDDPGRTAPRPRSIAPTAGEE